VIHKHSKTLLTIVAEAALHKLLPRDLGAFGAQSWTISEVTAAGREGVREGDWDADRTVEIKVICDAAVADAIAEHVLSTYAPNYQVMMSFGAVTVLRPERY
jgi:hypothetical protein